MKRLLVILIGLDQFLLTLLTLGECKRGETISAAAWSLEQDDKLIGRILRPVIDAIFFLDPDHCANSWHGEQPLQKDAP